MCLASVTNSDKTELPSKDNIEILAVTKVCLIKSISIFVMLEVRKEYFPRFRYITGPSSEVGSTSVITQLKQMENTTMTGYYMSLWKGQLIIFTMIFVPRLLTTKCILSICLADC